MTIREWLDRNETALRKKRNVLIVHTESTWHIGQYKSRTNSRLVITGANGSDRRILLFTINEIERVTHSAFSRFLKRVVDSVSVIFEEPLPRLKKATQVTAEEICRILEALDSLLILRVNEVAPRVFLDRE